MQILKVIQNHGYTLEQVATMLGITKGSLSATINGSPNVKKLIDIALKIGCSPAEFFDDWYENEGKSQQSADKMGSAHEVSTEGKQSPGDLPWEKTSTVAEELQAVEEESKMTAAVPGALICPHCGKAFVIEIKNIV